MILYPAIELREPDTNAAEVLAQADHFSGMGFERLYVIDRAAQYQGTPFNTDAVRTLVAHTRMPVWAGGGIRDVATIRTLLQAGVERVIVGPTFWLQTGLLQQTAPHFPGKLIAMIDALNGYITHFSATSAEKERVLDMALLFERYGVSGILYMEHEREGAMGSLDTEVIADLAFSLSIPLYVTGGINSITDLRALKSEASTGIAGVVLGRALVDGRIDPVSALALLKSQNMELS